MRIIASQVALSESIALSAVPELTLSQLARALRGSTSSAQRALEILMEDGAAARSSGPGVAYRLLPGQVSTHLVGLALAFLSLPRVVAVAARANPAVEYAAADQGHLYIVYSSSTDSQAVSRAARLLAAAASAAGRQLEEWDHDEVRQLLLASPALRGRMAAKPLIHGDLDRSFPDRSQHGLVRGQPLGHPHPALRVPNPRAIQRLAANHRLLSLKLFGSAIRSDFRPDSDVDLAVRFRPGVPPSLRSLIALERGLEAGFERDVDLVKEERLSPEVLEAVEGQAVSLL